MHLHLEMLVEQGELKEQFPCKALLLSSLQGYKKPVCSGFYMGLLKLLKLTGSWGIRFSQPGCTKGTCT